MNGLNLVRTGDRQLEQRLRLEGDREGDREGTGSDFVLSTPWPGAQTDLPAISVSARWLWDKELPVALAEHRNFLVADQVAATLAQGDIFDAAEIDDGGAHGNQPLFAAIANT